MDKKGWTPRKVTIDRRDALKAAAAVPMAAFLSPVARVSGKTTSAPKQGSGGEQNPGDYDPQQLNPYAIKSIPALGELVPDKKFIWADLRAFDNTSPGLGAPGYLKNLGFKPDAIFVLITHPDFVFLHNNLSSDAPLEPRFAVYGGSEVPGQGWSRFQLKGLIEHMHKAGVKVLLSLMTMVPQNDPGWSRQHPEVMTVTKDGEVEPAVNPLKRFKDGQLFEDVFIENLQRTMSAYGFDGFQGADGFTHLRLQVNVADFSDDMVDQFLSYTKIELPAGLARQCGTDVRAIKARAGWIWGRKGVEWIGFWRHRWASFWQKLAEGCKRNGKMVVANQPWTRDPYEAIYRFGFDYKTLEKIGLDALIVETVAGPVHFGGYVRNPDGTGVSEATRIGLEDATSMVMCIKAYVPSLPLVFLLCVQDENEQWDTLRHAPDFLEKEIFSYLSTFYITDRGTLERCLDGFVVCLGVGLSKEEWKRVSRTAARAFAVASSNELKNSVVTAVWSDRIMEGQLERHLARRGKWPRPPLHSQMKTLLHEGAPARAMVRSENVQKVEGPLLLINPEFMNEDESSKVREWLGSGDLARSLMVMGEDIGNFQPEVLCIRDYPEYSKLRCSVVAKSKAEQQRLRKELSASLKLYEPEDPSAPIVSEIDKASAPYFRPVEVEPAGWYELLGYAPVYRDFILDAAKALAVMANPPVASDHGKIFSIANGPDSRFVIVENDYPAYLWCTLSVDRPIKVIKLISSFPKRPSMRGDRSFDIKVAPDGVAVLEVDFQ